MMQWPIACWFSMWQGVTVDIFFMFFLPNPLDRFAECCACCFLCGRYKYPPWWAALPDVFAAMQSYAAWHSNEQDAFELWSTITSRITQTSAVASAKKKTHEKPICPCHVLDVTKRCWLRNVQYINQHKYDRTWTWTYMFTVSLCMHVETKKRERERDTERERESCISSWCRLSHRHNVILQSYPSKPGTWLLLDPSRVYWSGFGQCWREFCKFEYNNIPSRFLPHLKGVLEVFANWLGASLAHKTLASEKLPDKNGSCSSCGCFCFTVPLATWMMLLESFGMN